MKKTLVYLFSISLLINPALLMAQEAIVQFDNIHFENSINLTPEQLCGSRNADFTCKGSLAYINSGRGFRYSEVNDRISCNLDENNSWEFALEVLIEEDSQPVQGQVFKGDCDVPRGGTFSKIDAQSWQAAINSCVNMGETDCTYIWKDNSGSFFIGRRWTIHEAAIDHYNFWELRKRGRDPQDRLNERI